LGYAGKHKPNDALAALGFGFLMAVCSDEVSGAYSCHGLILPRMPAARMDEVPKVEPSTAKAVLTKVIAQAKDSAFPKISMIELKQDAISEVTVLPNELQQPIP
jgi:hypothetical protein